MLGDSSKRAGGRSSDKRQVECGHPDRGHESRGMCSPCYTRWRYERNRKELIAKSRAANLLNQFGITQDEYDRMEAEQGGLCAICSSPCRTGRRLAVDHDHKTGMVRALLCTRCNNGLGNFLEDTTLLDKAKKYLDAHGGKAG